MKTFCGGVETMDALLASYGSDSDSDNEQQQDEIERTQEQDDILETSSTKDLFSKLPKVQTPSVDSRKRHREEEILEPIVQRHQWELEEAPKPPTKAKRKVPVKIFLPELSADGDLSDEDQDINKASNKSSLEEAPGACSVKLLSMLPAPKRQPKGRLLLPTVLNKPKPTTKSLPKPGKEKPTELVVKSAGPGVQNYNEEEGSDSEDSADFLGLAASKETLEIGPGAGAEERGENYGPARPPPELPGSESPEYSTVPSSSYPHPSQAYNYVGGSPDSEREVAESSGISDERAAQLIYKNELQHWGVQQEEVQIPEIVDINVDRQLGPNVRENLLKNLSGRPVPPPSAAKQKEKDKDKPGQTAKRKHQITYLAFVAKQKEEQLKDQWSNNKFSRAQTRAKYGF